ncbi:hypothetical protein GD429_25595 [Burkholderia sp. BE17]|nr:hypothetical protein [Burkholderia sp. BE17]
MPGAAQCGSSPRRRFRDTGPIIKQRDADRQPSAPQGRHGPWPVAAALAVVAAPSGVAFRQRGGRTAAILPVQARVGLLTDCKGS